MLNKYLLNEWIDVWEDKDPSQLTQDVAATSWWCESSKTLSNWSIYIHTTIQGGIQNNEKADTVAQPSFGLTVTEKMDMKPLIQQIQWNKQPLPSDMLPLTSEPKLYFQPKNISLSLSFIHSRPQLQEWLEMHILSTLSQISKMSFD